jgi:bifunctional DNA-binding transcriptional regulator/antitoxin component of YhaV-PrlF toxin-antitoxin module
MSFMLLLCNQLADIHQCLVYKVNALKIIVPDLPTVSMPTEIKTNHNGSLTIPANELEKAGIRPDDDIIIEPGEGSLLIRKAPAQTSTSLPLPEKISPPAFSSSRG